MNIPPQLWNEIIKSEKSIFAPVVNGILYCKPLRRTGKRSASPVKPSPRFALGNSKLAD